MRSRGTSGEGSCCELTVDLDRRPATSEWPCSRLDAAITTLPDRLQPCSLMYASYITADGSPLSYRDHLDPREKRYAPDLITVRQCPAERHLFKGP